MMDFTNSTHNTKDLRKYNTQFEDRDSVEELNDEGSYSGDTLKKL